MHWILELYLRRIAQRARAQASTKTHVHRSSEWLDDLKNKFMVARTKVMLAAARRQMFTEEWVRPFSPATVLRVGRTRAAHPKQRRF